jgi:hypothetical protein
MQNFSDYVWPSTENVRVMRLLDMCKFVDAGWKPENLSDDAYVAKCLRIYGGPAIDALIDRLYNVLY